MAITIKNDEEIELMRKAGQILARVHTDLARELREGMSTKEIDKLAYELIFSYGGVPNFLNYNGFPASVCVSVNEEVVHGIPSEKRFLRSGDIVSIDGGVLYEGYHSDAARTYGIGEISEEARKLIEVTEESFFEAIKMARPGNHIVDIGRTVQTYALKNGYSVVRDLTGHGIGTSLHEAPNIPNYKTFFRGPRIRKGMTLAVEPMVNLGNYSVTRLDDDWTYATADGTLSAHYENTIAITDKGCEILTMLPEELERKFGRAKEEGNVQKGAGKDDSHEDREIIIKDTGKADHKAGRKSDRKSAEEDDRIVSKGRAGRIKEEAEEGLEERKEGLQEELPRSKEEGQKEKALPRDEEKEPDRDNVVRDEKVQEVDAAAPALEKTGKVPYASLTAEEKRTRREALFEDD